MSPSFVLQPPKHEETTFSHAFIVVLIPYFIGAILSKKCQKWGVGKKDIKGGWPHRGLLIEWGGGSNLLDTMTSK